MVLVLIIIFFGATMQVIKGFGWLSVIYLFFLGTLTSPILTLWTWARNWGLLETLANSWVGTLKGFKPQTSIPWV